MYMSGLADLSITMVKGMEGLQTIKDDWNRIHSGLEHPAYHQDWRWMAALQQRLITQPLRFVILQRRNQVVAIVPLHLRSDIKARIKHNHLSFPYHNHVVLSDALVDADRIGEKDFREILYFLETQREFSWDFIRLSGIYDRSPLRDQLVQSGLKLEEASANAYFNWDGGRYDATLSKKFIKNIRRLATKAEQEMGPLNTRYVSDPESLPAAYELFLELEASGWKGEAGTSTAIKHDPQLVSFYTHLLDTFSCDDSFQINLLEINGVPAAGQMCIRSGHTWFIMKVGYNDDLKQYGAGNILMLSFLEQVSSQPAITELNLVTSPVWADRWHLNKRPVFAVQHFNNNIKGRLTKVMKRSNKMLKGFMGGKSND